MTVCLVVEKSPHASAANLTFKRLNRFVNHISQFVKNIHVVLGGVINKDLQNLSVTKVHYVPYYGFAKRGILYILTHILYLIYALFRTCAVIKQNKEIKIVINIGEHWSSGLITLLAGKFTHRYVIMRVIGSVKIPLILFKRQTKNRINLITSNIQKILSKVDDITLKYCDAIITVTPLLNDLLREKYAYKTFIVPLGIDTTVFHPKKINRILKQEYNGQHHLMYIGRLSAEKGLEYLFKALKSIILHFPNIKLLIIGEGNYRRELELVVKNLDLKKYVCFLGFKNSNEIVDYFSIADIFVLPSLSEYLPNAILEAMACEVPVIATNVGGIPHVIKEDVTGKLVEPKNSSELAQTIIYLLNSEAKRKELTRSALSEIRKKYSVEACKRRYGDIFRFLKQK